MKKGVLFVTFVITIFAILVIFLGVRDRVEVPPFPESAGDTLGFAVAEEGGISDPVEIVNGTTVLHLEKGWNMVSFVLNPVEEGTTDRVVTLEPGWNLIGYSSEFRPELSQNNIEIDSAPVAQAVEKGKIQNQFAYYEARDEMYKLVSSQSGDLRTGRGYWVKSNSQSQMKMKLKGVGGSIQDASVNVDDLIFVNGVGEESGYKDARQQWGVQIRRYDSINRKFSSINDGEMINAWEGYFINSQNGPVTIRVG